MNMARRVTMGDGPDRAHAISARVDAVIYISAAREPRHTGPVIFCWLSLQTRAGLNSVVCSCALRGLWKALISWASWPGAHFLGVLAWRSGCLRVAAFLVEAFLAGVFLADPFLAELFLGARFFLAG